MIESIALFTRMPASKESGEKVGYGIRNERDEIISNMQERINKEREGTKWKPLSVRAVVMKVSHLKGFELNWFYCECCKAESFGRYFFGKLK